MSPRYSNLLDHPAMGEDALIQRQMLETIESIRHTVRASHRTMDDARDAIARADKALAGRTRVCALSTGGGLWDVLCNVERPRRGQGKGLGDDVLLQPATAQASAIEILSCTNPIPVLLGSRAG